MPQQLAEEGPVDAIQAIAAGVEIAVKPTTGPQAGPQAGPLPNYPILPGIAEEREDDGAGGGQPAGGNNVPVKNAPTKNVPAKNVPTKNVPTNNVPTNNVPTSNAPAKSAATKAAAGNDTTGNTTGNTNTFNDPSNLQDEASLRLRQQTAGGGGGPTPVVPVVPLVPVVPVFRRPVVPMVRLVDPPTWPAHIFKLLLAACLLGIAWWFWTSTPATEAQYSIGSPYELAQQLGQRLGFGKSVDVGSVVGKTLSAPEYSVLLQRINTLERRLDAAAPEAAAGSQVRQINYFAIGAGAIIEPYITSPTKTTRRPFSQKVKGWYFGIYYPEGYGPMAALSSWDDMGDCWCAPPSDHHWVGQAQLGVLLPRRIFPTELVIEHIPASATFDIDSAPKELELWAMIEDDTAREAVGNAVFPLLPNDSNIVSPRSLTQQFADPTQQLDYRYIRIGKWRYDIHSGNNIQTFTVPVDLKHFDAVVNKVVVRSLNNWGFTSYTCFYRLKLHGELAFPDEVREENKHLPKTWLHIAFNWLSSQFYGIL